MASARHEKLPDISLIMSLLLRRITILLMNVTRRRKSRYWAIPGQEGYTHIIGGLEKDGKTGAISTEPENHNLMCHLRAEKVAKIQVPDLEVQGDKDDAELLIVGFGGTYGHLYSAMDELSGKVIRWLSHILNTSTHCQRTPLLVLGKYKKVVVAEQNLGQFAALSAL
jgi:2-oxoglutarate ferredoxin oxidoreductase subunit alpha